MPSCPVFGLPVSSSADLFLQRGISFAKGGLRELRAAAERLSRRHEVAPDAQRLVRDLEAFLHRLEAL
jgi:hypothetical protein